MKQPVSNNTASPMYLAGRMIPPGETRLFEPHEIAGSTPVPDLSAPPAAESVLPTPVELTELLKGSVNTIVAGLAALTLEEVQALAALEQGADKPRNSLLAALTAEVLQRQAPKDPPLNGGESSGAGEANSNGEGTPPAPNGED